MTWRASHTMACAAFVGAAAAASGIAGAPSGTRGARYLMLHGDVCNLGQPDTKEEVMTHNRRA
ncbi:MAG: hypothetical protein HY271_01995 [Deltaproteobacteria bacterium]|nr:hypothetical protein [Deltaproteobacteria bacterium]